MAYAIIENAPPTGTPIGVREAAQKYDIPPTTISGWIDAQLVPWIQMPRGRGAKGYIDEHYVYLWKHIAPPHRGRRKPLKSP